MEWNGVRLDMGKNIRQLQQCVKKSLSETRPKFGAPCGGYSSRVASTKTSMCRATVNHVDLLEPRGNKMKQDAMVRLKSVHLFK